MFASAAAGIAPEAHGVATALASTSQQIGGAVGLAALVAVADAGLDPHHRSAIAPSALVHGLRDTGWVAAAVTGALIALSLKRPVADRAEPVDSNTRLPERFQRSGATGGFGLGRNRVRPRRARRKIIEYGLQYAHA